MATDIVQTLFGITPEGYQRQQDALLDARALKFAELDPMAQATYGIYRGAGQLGGALGRALGGEDPELARISLRQSLARQIDYNNPESIQAGVRSLTQAGDTMGAMMLADTARKAASEIALAQQRGREGAAKSPLQELLRSGKYTPASIGTYANTGDIAQLVSAEAGDKPTSEQANARAFAATKGKPGTPEYDAAYRDKLTELIAKAPPTTPSVGAEAERIAQAAPYNKPYAQLTPEQKAEVNAKVEAQATARARASATNITNVQEKAELGARGKMLVEDYGAISKQAGVAARSLPALEINLAVLDKGFDTGFGTEVKATGARVLAALGVKDAEKFATDAQTFLANASAAVLQRQLEQKGPQTEADAQRITQTGAQLGNTKEANRFLLNIAKAQLKRDIAQRDFYAAWYKKNTTYDGAEDAWFAGAGGKSLFDSPELKKYAVGGAAAQIPTTATPPAAANIPQAAIDALKAGRGTKAQFDQLFGAGAADRVLGGK